MKSGSKALSMDQDTANVLAVVTARGGSKGVPGKNIRDVAGKPLIAWTLEAASHSCRIARLILSTDSEAIAEVARRFGVDVPFLRPAELAQDDSPHLPVLLHALEWMRKREDFSPEYVLLLQPTSPLRTADDIDAAIELAMEEDAEAVVSVCETHQHPHLVVAIGTEGTLSSFSPGAPEPGTPQIRRQALPPAYFVNGALYLARTDVLLEQRTLMPARTFPYIMPVERSLQIDDPWDLRMAELLLGDEARSEGRSGR